jgi:hypothetical protein
MSSILLPLWFGGVKIGPAGGLPICACVAGVEAVTELLFCTSKAGQQ